MLKPNKSHQKLIAWLCEGFPFSPLFLTEKNIKTVIDHYCEKSRVELHHFCKFSLGEEKHGRIAAQYLEELEQFDAAAEVYRMLKDKASLSRCEEKGGRHWAAAETAKESGDEERAQMLYERYIQQQEGSGMYMYAAAGAKKKGEHLRAADFFRKAGQPCAIDEYAKLGYFDIAMDMCEEQKYFEKGIQIAMDTRDILKALDLYSKAITYYSEQDLKDNGERIERLSLEKRLLMHSFKEYASKAGLEPTQVVHSQASGNKELGLCLNCNSLHDSGEFCSSCGRDLWPSDSDKNLSGRYAVRERLGRGASGEVYLVHDKILNLEKVVKTITMKDCVDSSPISMEWFENEAGILSGLTISGLPKVIDKYCNESKGFMVMDFVGEKDLEQLMLEMSGKGIRSLPEKQVAEYALKVLDILKELHSQKPEILHRDIKPANIRIDKSGNVWLVDFGIARQANATGTNRTKMTIAGTLGYIAPEQRAGKPVPASDIYGLGATMFYLLTGQVLGDSDNQNILGDICEVRSVNSEISESLSYIVRKATEKNLVDRFGSAGEMKAVLVDYLSGKAINISEDKQDQMSNRENSSAKEQPYHKTAYEKSLEQAIETMRSGIQINDSAIKLEKFKGQLMEYLIEKKYTIGGGNIWLPENKFAKLKQKLCQTADFSIFKENFQATRVVFMEMKKCWKESIADIIAGYGIGDDKATGGYEKICVRIDARGKQYFEEIISLARSIERDFQGQVYAVNVNLKSEHTVKGRPLD